MRVCRGTSYLLEIFHFELEKKNKTEKNIADNRSFQMLFLYDSKFFANIFLFFSSTFAIFSRTKRIVS